MKKNDIYIIGGIVISLIISVIMCVFLYGEAGKTVVITEKGKTVYEGNINSEKTVKLSHNTVVIENGEVFIESATCKNQVCVNHKSIKNKGETIACLPNGVLVEVE